MELKQIKELMALMEKAGVKKLYIKEKTGYEIEIEREGEERPHLPAQLPPFYAHKEQATHAPTKEQDAPKKEEGRCVLSPMVGTFYGSPSPDASSYVKVGDRVDENTIVCIIEAMKVMNEVKAGISGTVAEVLVQNAHPVEFGTKLFRIV